MKRLSVTVLLILMVAPVSASMNQVMKPEPGSCEELTYRLKLPHSLGKRKGPSRVKWEDVDKIVTRVRDDMQGRECILTFGQLFEVKEKKEEEVYFPLTNNLLRTVPESSFQGVQVYNLEGKALGQFDSRVQHERSGGLYAKKSYTLFSFQFKNPAGEFEAVGGRLLLDDYLVKWNDIKDKVAITSK